MRAWAAVSTFIVTVLLTVAPVVALQPPAGQEQFVPAKNLPQAETIPAAPLLVAAYAFIEESRDTSHEQRPDIPGLVTSALGLFSLSYALIESNTYGWTSGRILGSRAARDAYAAELRRREERAAKKSAANS